MEDYKYTLDGLYSTLRAFNKILEMLLKDGETEKAENIKKGILDTLQQIENIKSL